jgi:hypothetical protein
MPTGQPCRAGPQRDRPWCFAHDPERVEEATEARRLGGIRRRKEGTIAVAYDLPGLDTVEGIRRLLDITSVDALGLENGVARLRILVAVVGAATRLLEVGDLEASRPRDMGNPPRVGTSLLDEPLGFPIEAHA